MMKRMLCAVALAAVLMTVTSCLAGPSRLSRSFDDYLNQKYTENAWVHGVLLRIIPVYPIIGSLAALGDVTFVNTYYFWSDDAWDNKGTGFIHDQLPEETEKVVSGSGLKN